jgi:hypothetical protein
MGGAHDRADVARVAHAMQIRRQLPARLGPALRVDPDHARARAEGADRVEQPRLHVLAGNQHEGRFDARGLGRGDQILALGCKQAGAVALAAAGELTDRLQLLVFGACDHLVTGRGKKKGRPAIAVRPGSPRA